MNILSIVWDPNIGLDLGFFTIRYYSMMYIVGFLAGYIIMKKIFENEKIDTALMDPLLTYAITGVLLGARLGHVFFYDWKYYKHHLEEILLPIRDTGNGYEFTGFQGLASHGATIGLFLATLYFWNKHLNLSNVPQTLSDAALCEIYGKVGFGTCTSSDGALVDNNGTVVFQRNTSSA